jgi:hypothetical protein
MKPTFSKTTPLEDCVKWARQWAEKCSNRVVIAKKAYIGGFPIDT